MSFNFLLIHDFQWQVQWFALHGEGASTYNFPKNCTQLKEFGPRWDTRPKYYYVDLPHVLMDWRCLMASYMADYEKSSLCVLAHDTLSLNPSQLWRKTLGLTSQKDHISLRSVRLMTTLSCFAQKKFSEDTNFLSMVCLIRTFHEAVFSVRHIPPCICTAVIKSVDSILAELGRKIWWKKWNRLWGLPYWKFWHPDVFEMTRRIKRRSCSGFFGYTLLFELSCRIFVNSRSWDIY